MPDPRLTETEISALLAWAELMVRDNPNLAGWVIKACEEIRHLRDRNHELNNTVMVAALEEREACARLCEESGGYGYERAAAIRARGRKS